MSHNNRDIEEHKLAAGIIANAIHIHRDPATFSVASKIPSGRPATNDDKILRTYVEAHLKLREYMLSVETKPSGTRWPGSGPLVLPWVNATTIVPSNIAHHKWTVRKLDGTSHQTSSALEAGSISNKNLESSESRPPSSLSGSASSLRRHEYYDQCSKINSSLSGPSSSADHRTRRRQQHAARLDDSRNETRASSPIGTGTQEKARTPSPYRRLLSFVNGTKRTRSWCSSNE